MYGKKSPGIIMTSQFTTASAKSFTRYIEYTVRKEALDYKDVLTETEQKELRRISNVLENYELNKDLEKTVIEENNIDNEEKKDKQKQ